MEGGEERKGRELEKRGRERKKPRKGEKEEAKREVDGRGEREVRREEERKVKFRLINYKVKCWLYLVEALSLSPQQRFTGSQRMCGCRF